MASIFRFPTNAQEIFEVSSRLAAACGAQWGIWATGFSLNSTSVCALCRRAFAFREALTSCPECNAPVLCFSGRGESRTYTGFRSAGLEYLQHCSERGIDPGDLPSPEWGSVDNHIRWRVLEDEITIMVGQMFACVRPGRSIQIGGTGIDEDLIELGRIVQQMRKEEES